MRDPYGALDAEVYVGSGREAFFATVCLLNPTRLFSGPATTVDKNLYHASLPQPLFYEVLYLLTDEKVTFPLSGLSCGICRLIAIVIINICGFDIIWVSRGGPYRFQL